MRGRRRRPADHVAGGVGDQDADCCWDRAEPTPGRRSRRCRSGSPGSMLPEAPAPGRSRPPVSVARDQVARADGRAADQVARRPVDEDARLVGERGEARQVGADPVALDRVADGADAERCGRPARRCPRSGCPRTATSRRSVERGVVDEHPDRVGQGGPTRDVGADQVPLDEVDGRSPTPPNSTPDDPLPEITLVEPGHRPADRSRRRPVQEDAVVAGCPSARGPVASVPIRLPSDDGARRGRPGDPDPVLARCPRSRCGAWRSSRRSSPGRPVDEDARQAVAQGDRPVTSVPIRLPSDQVEDRARRRGSRSRCPGSPRSMLRAVPASCPPMTTPGRCRSGSRRPRLPSDGLAGGVGADQVPRDDRAGRAGPLISIRPGGCPRSRSAAAGGRRRSCCTGRCRPGSRTGCPGVAHGVDVRVPVASSPTRLPGDQVAGRVRAREDQARPGVARDHVAGAGRRPADRVARPSR